jgi:hypothetical protein
LTLFGRVSFVVFVVVFAFSPCCITARLGGHRADASDVTVAAAGDLGDQRCLGLEPQVRRRKPHDGHVGHERIWPVAVVERGVVVDQMHVPRGRCHAVPQEHGRRRSSDKTKRHARVERCKRVRLVVNVGHFILGHARVPA